MILDASTKEAAKRCFKRTAEYNIYVRTFKFILQTANITYRFPCLASGITNVRAEMRALVKMHVKSVRQRNVKWIIKWTGPALNLLLNLYKTEMVLKP